MDEDEGQVRFSIDEVEFWLDLDSYSLGRTTAAVLHARALRQPKVIRRHLNKPNVRELPSPDGAWLATLRDHNVWLRSAERSSHPSPIDPASTKTTELKSLTSTPGNGNAKCVDSNQQLRFKDFSVFTVRSTICSESDVIISKRSTIDSSGVKLSLTGKRRRVRAERGKTRSALQCETASGSFT